MSVLRFLRNTAVDLCLGCRHEHVTRPFTIADDTYLVCLDCGHQLAYSAEGMRPLSRREARRRRAERVAASAAGVAMMGAPAAPVRVRLGRRKAALTASEESHLAA